MVHASQLDEHLHNVGPHLSSVVWLMQYPAAAPVVARGVVARGGAAPVVGGTIADALEVVVVVGAVVVTVVPGHAPSPGWQSGMSLVVGHALPAPVGMRTSVIKR